jgi:hypothetical protein
MSAWIYFREDVCPDPAARGEYFPACYLAFASPAPPKGQAFWYPAMSGASQSQTPEPCQRVLDALRTAFPDDVFRVEVVAGRRSHGKRGKTPAAMRAATQRRAEQGTGPCWIGFRDDANGRQYHTAVTLAFAQPEATEPVLWPLRDAFPGVSFGLEH